MAGIRPCHILPDEGKLTAKVEVSGKPGNEVNLHTHCEGDHVVMAISTMNLETDVSMGRTIRFSTQPRLIRLFDKKTQNNLIRYDETSAMADAPVCRAYSFQSSSLGRKDEFPFFRLPGLFRGQAVNSGVE